VQHTGGDSRKEKDIPHPGVANEDRVRPVLLSGAQLKAA
jgi:hypothetical protein